MKVLLSRIHARLGDLWWYTGIQFAAARCGDLINAFIGLWLVPKWVGMDELGAVLPLTYFATFLAMPMSAFTTALTKEVNVLSVRGERGKLKSLLRGVFIAVAVFLVVAFFCVRYAMPLVLERIRVEEGLLGFVIIASALAGSSAPVYLYTLQALKRFKTFSVINLCCSPIRLVVLLVAMPFRALTGYFVGQGASPCFQIAASVFVLRHDIGRSVKAEVYWTRETVRSFLRYAVLIAVPMFVGGLVSFVEPLIIRQRLPAVDSAAFYMISRFAEVGTYLGLTLSTIVFPYVSEECERGGSGNRLIARAMIGSLSFGVLCAVLFGVFGRRALLLLPNGADYAAYVPELVILTLILSVGAAVGCFTSGEIAAKRFNWLLWSVPLTLLYVGTLFALTGYGYLRGIVPDALIAAIESWRVCRLDFLLGLMGAFAGLKMLFVVLQMMLRCNGKA